MSESEHSEKSYAEVAASGPQQSEEELTHNRSRAPPVDEVIPTDQSVESLIDVNTGVAVVPNDFKEQEVKTETQAARIEIEAAAAEDAAAAAAEDAAEKQKKAPKSEKKATAKSLVSNPICQGNGALLAILSVVLGVGVYRKHQAGQLTWKLVAYSAVGVAAFLGADFAVSSWLYKKFPFAEKEKQK
ncbi:hypothetical protein FN846DRAFT_948274 [Sphaerosporella brunnea]|uniref:Uncharacterized protein n=1 Tax=Sphaerosporella brunnea TaxID=1250544 RepID=A0A5J5EYQ6_9PEZI|nr:hypothetical protein FN846DRAFT_948274 [Sphaerosporella brunnea]